jgi:putative PIG3 family NAD(P)H quinone oxidoreductase
MIKGLGTLEPAMPDLMLPARIRRIDHGVGGGPDVLRLVESERPSPRPGEILIRVAFAGVNRPDVSQRTGRYPPPPGASPWLGLEVSGTVAALGDGVSSWGLGEQVCALCNGGGYAEYVAVPAGQALPVPKGFSLERAAAIPETFFTVWTNVIDRGGLKAGERFLVHGGSSGIGMAAVQLAKAWGATVFATVGSNEKALAVAAAGAEHVINYRERDFQEAVAAITGKQGVDLILDMVGGTYVEKNLRSLTTGGRLVQIAFLQGAKVELDLTLLMTRRLLFTGSTLRPRSDSDKAAIAAALHARVWPLFEAGKIRPVLHARFDLSEAARAHALMESSTHIGKIMLQVDPKAV